MSQTREGDLEEEEIETLDGSVSNEAASQESLGFRIDEALLIETIDVPAESRSEPSPSIDPTPLIDETILEVDESQAVCSPPSADPTPLIDETIVKDDESGRFEMPRSAVEALDSIDATIEKADDCASEVFWSEDRLPHKQSSELQPTEPFDDPDATTPLGSNVPKGLNQTPTEVAPDGSKRGPNELDTLGIPTLSLDSQAANDSGEDWRVTDDPGAPGGGIISRFRMIRPHAKGGLGEVFLALDQELNREVALKQIQDRHADDSLSRSRFMIEAEVTGGLEHPGIVPVYSLGRYRDGRPYYAMRFIRGDSFKKAIARFHEADKTDRDPSERSLEFRKLLNRFVDVCEAIDYAHSRGILHRDIKPDNVMLGTHGETLVVDWGLAKALGKTEAPDTVPLILSPASGTTATLLGSTIGTPQFMSPEQANGEIDRLGPPSDVYSLGATLYQLLVGRTPFSGQNLHELLKKVRQGIFAKPREANAKVPAPLEAICLKAMSLKIEDRYQTAQELASDVEAWLADEPVSAWTEPWNVRLERWAKRHKTAVAAATVLAASLIVSLSIGTVLIAREKERTAANFRMAREAADDLLTQVGSIDLADLPQMETIRLALLQRAAAYYERFLADNRETLAVRAETLRARARLGEIKALLGDLKGAEKNFLSSIAPLRRLLSDSPRDLELIKDLGRAYVQFGVLQKREGRLRDAERSLLEGVRLREAAHAMEPKDEDLRAAVVDARYQLASLLRRRGGTRSEVRKAYDLAIKDQKKRLEEKPADAAAAAEQARYYNNLGILQSGVDPAAATEAFLRSLQINAELLGRTETVPSLHWRFARSSNNIGQLDLARKDFAAARQDFETAKAHLAWLMLNYPAIPDYRAEHAAVLISLANVESDQGEWTTAEKRFREARDALNSLIEKYPDFVEYRLRLADAWLGEGIRRTFAAAKFSEAPKGKASADEAFSQAVAILEKLVAEEPSAPEYRDRLAAVYENSADFFLERNDRRRSRSAIDRALELQRTTLIDDPDHRDYALAQANHLALRSRLDSLENRAIDLDNDAKEMLSLSADGPESYIVAAEALASYAGRILNDRSLPAAERKSLWSKFSTLGGRLIQAAVERDGDGRLCLNGQGDPKLSLDDPKFDSIRDTPPFQKARAELERKIEERRKSKPSRSV